MNALSFVFLSLPFCIYCEHQTRKFRVVEVQNEHFETVWNAGCVTAAKLYSIYKPSILSSIQVYNPYWKNNKNEYVTFKLFFLLLRE